MYKDNFTPGLVCGLLIGALVCLFTGMVTHDAVTANMRDDAIDADVAEWQIDAKDGEREFVYLNPEE